MGGMMIGNLNDPVKEKIRIGTVKHSRSIKEGARHLLAIDLPLEQEVGIEDSELMDRAGDSAALSAASPNGGGDPKRERFSDCEIELINLLDA
jgi:plasmid stability protein